MNILRGPKLRNRFFETIDKHIGNKRVVFTKNAKMCLVVATYFYMINIVYLLDFIPYARMDGCTPL